VACISGELVRSAIGLSAILAALTLVVSPASALPRTWVSGTGAGAACTRAAPCATFQAAHDATDPNGEINCVDSGSYGTVTITKPITVDCAGVLGTISTTSVGVVVETAGVVRLRNLTITHEGSGPGNGILFDSGVAGALFIEKCTVTNSDIGIRFFAINGATMRLFVSDTVVSGGGSGIGLQTNASSARGRATIDGVRSEANSFFGAGLALGGGFGTSLLIAHVRNSLLTGNSGKGLSAFAQSSDVDHGIVSVTTDRSSITLNGTGILNQGQNSYITVGRSTVISNDTGIQPGANIVSYGNNHLTGNRTDGAPTRVLNLK
jgi:hypothetical protein